MSGPIEQPTSVRYVIIGWATIMSLLLYLDRFCISICTNYIRQDLNVDPTIVGRLSTAFFFAYALGQVPAGWLTDRFGVRMMLSLFILGWSACTGLQAFAQSFVLLAGLQLFCGLFQAGAYPAGARLVRDWNPPTTRGFGSAMVALGGRIGGALAPILTAWMLIQFVPVSTDSIISEAAWIDPIAFGKKLKPKADWPEEPRAVDLQLQHTWNALTEHEQTLIFELAAIDDENTARRSSAVVKQTVINVANHVNANFWERLVNSWESPLPPVALQTADDEQALQLRTMLNRLISSPDFYRPSLFDQTIEREGRRLSEKREALAKQRKSLSDDELRRLNRLALESTFPKELGNVYVSGWRPSMLVYGVLGVLVAALFWWQVRDTPQQDCRCNSAERELISMGSAPVAAVAPREPFPWLALLTNISLWGNCLLQITTNIGWVFLVRTMPQYLEEVHRVPLVMRGWMTSVPIWAGVIGVFFGGRLTDWLGQRLGLKWGRRLPVLVTRITAAMGYAICIALSFLVPNEEAPTWMPWVYVAALSLVAVSTDIGVPAVWAFMQDIGGRHTAAVLGWGNMWGNLGAAAATEIYARILGRSAGMYEWNMLFACLGGSFLLSAVGALLMDSSKPLVPERRNIA